MTRSTASDQRRQGVKSLNQQYKRYEQVNKNQTYGLSENPDVDRFDDEFEIQVCDMAPWFEGTPEGKAQFSETLGRAMEDIGFAILVNHGVDTRLFDRADRKIREFFETIPAAEREPYLAERHGSVNQGYFPVNETTIIRSRRRPGLRRAQLLAAVRFRAGVSRTDPGRRAADPAADAGHAAIPGLRPAPL